MVSKSRRNLTTKDAGGSHKHLQLSTAEESKFAWIFSRVGDQVRKLRSIFQIRRRLRKKNSWINCYSQGSFMTTDFVRVRCNTVLMKSPESCRAGRVLLMEGLLFPAMSHLFLVPFSHFSFQASLLAALTWHSLLHSQFSIFWRFYSSFSRRLGIGG